MARIERQRLTKQVARTRMLLKAPLGWLVGFPLEMTREGDSWKLQWWSPPGVAEQPKVLGERELRRASRALLEIRGELQEALPHAVPDPKRWLACAAAKLEAAGRMVHYGEDPSAICPPRPKTLTGLDDLRGRHPRMVELTDAVVWSLWTTPWLGRKTNRWLTDHAQALEAIFDPGVEERMDCNAMIPAMNLLSAATEGTRGAGALLAALGHPDLEVETRFHVATQHVKAILPTKTLLEPPRDSKVKAPGRTHARSRLLDFLRKWSDWDRTRRREVARVWSLVFDGNLFEDWSSWWHDVGAIRGRLQNFEQLERTLRDPVKMLKALEESLRQRLEGVVWRRMPATFVVDKMLDVLEKLSARPELIKATRKALELVPARLDEKPIRIALVNHWYSLLDERDLSPRLPSHIDSFRRLVASVGESALGPWERLFHEGYSGDLPIWTPDEYYFEWPDPPALDSAEMSRVCVGLSKIPIAKRDLVFCTCLSGADFDTASEAVSWAFEKGCSLDQVDTDLAGPLGTAVDIAPDAASLGRILLRLGRLKDSEPPALLMAGARCLAGRSPGQRRAWATVEMVDCDPGALVDLGRRLRLAERLGHRDDGAVPEWLGSTDRSWVEAYPAQLRPDLHALADCDIDGKRTARKILLRQVRDVPSLEQELAAVEAKIGQTDPEDGEEAPSRRELEVRRDKLLAWIEQPQVLSEGKLARLRLRLRRAMGAAKLADLRARLDDCLREALRRQAVRLLGEVPDSFEVLLEPDPILLLDAVVALDDKAARRFGLEILLRRCSSPPWDLRDHPDNVRFRRRMTESGVDLGPWINGDFRCTLEGSNGQPLTLTIERDPLQILRMGAPFGTCLSPWDFNFFSAVANTVDLDKQVVFGRDVEGRVMARCLMALGQSTAGEDALIAFYPYAHDASLGFREMMAEYAAGLAEALGIPLATRGKVTPLVCPNWYDDGPHDLRGDLDFLADGSPFRKALPDMEPDELAGALVDEALRVDAHVLAALLPCLERHPQLVTGVAHWIDRLSLPAIDRLRAAALARRAGREDLAKRWLEQCAGHLRGLSDFPWWNRPLGEILADLAPSLTLHLLRETRDRSVRSWAQERDGYRLWVAGRAHLALHRENKARELFQRIVDQDGYYGDQQLSIKASRAVAAMGG
ncbi:MAG: hypothetical protein MPN21_04740 [Thermoanaerobaculia bacterium]|nr:hypothetical protein [Thermoanaerobaculia bacterium]